MQPQPFQQGHPLHNDPGRSRVAREDALKASTEAAGSFRSRGQVYLIRYLRKILMGQIVGLPMRS